MSVAIEQHVRPSSVAVHRHADHGVRDRSAGRARRERDLEAPAGRDVARRAAVLADELDLLDGQLLAPGAVAAQLEQPIASPSAPASWGGVTSIVSECIRARYSETTVETSPTARTAPSCSQIATA